MSTGGRDETWLRLRNILPMTADGIVPSSFRRHYHPIKRRRFLSGLLLLQLVSFLPVNMVLSMVADIPVPKGKAYLPFQAESIPLLTQTPRILLADEMGLGKTITVIGAFNAWMKEQQQQQKSKQRKTNKVWPRILIISPKSVIPNWQQELTNWLVTTETRDDEKEQSFSEWTVGIVTAKKGFPDVQTNVLLINYDIVERKREELDQWGPFDFLVCDEAHYLKTCDSKRTMAILGHVDDSNDDNVDASTKNKKKKKRKHDPIQTERLWLLTGSPILNNPVELYPLLKSIDHDMKVFPELKSFDDFGEKYSYRKDTLWGHRYMGGKNLAQLRKRLHQKRDGKNGVPIMIRRTKDEVLKDLPPKRHQLLPLLDDGATARQEMELVEASVRELAAEQEMPVQPRTPPKRSTLKKMKVVELKQLLRANNLKVVGKKEELVERLYATRQETNTTDNHMAQTATTTIVAEEPTVAQTTRIMEDEELYNTAASALRSQTYHGKGKEALYDILFHLNLQKGETPAGVESQAALNMLTKARHETARAKVMHGIELIESAIQSHKVVVFAHHRDIQSQLREAFGKRAVGITGGDTLAARTEAIQAFQNDPTVSVFVGSLKAAGTGITLNAANHVIFMELDWSPLIMQQAEDRCHRVGQQSSVLVQYLYFPDTIDEYLAEMLVSKQSTISAAIDEASGSSSWVFDFGKYKGTTVGDVAGTKPSYLRWIVENQIYHRKPDLTIALKDLGLLSSDELMFEGNGKNGKPNLDARTEHATSDNGHPESWIFKGGTHKGKSVGEVAANDDAYLKWLANGSLYLDEPGLVLALDALGYIRLGTNNPDDRRPQGSTDAVTTTELVTHISPDAVPKNRVHGNWKFNFGKYTGETVANVFKSNPGYLNWLVETGVHQNKPELTLALEELGSIAPRKNVVATSALISDVSLSSKVQEENETSSIVTSQHKPISEDSIPNAIEEEKEDLLPEVTKEEAEDPLPDIIEEEEYVSEEVEKKSESPWPATQKSDEDGNKALATPGSYKMKFGKYDGSKIEDIPSQYLNWLLASPTGKRDPTMVMCVKNYLSQRKKNTYDKGADGEGKGTAVEGFYFYDNGYM